MLLISVSTVNIWHIFLLVVFGFKFQGCRVTTAKNHRGLITKSITHACSPRIECTARQDRNDLCHALVLSSSYLAAVSNRYVLRLEFTFFNQTAALQRRFRTWWATLVIILLSLFLCLVNWKPPVCPIIRVFYCYQNNQLIWNLVMDHCCYFLFGWIRSQIGHRHRMRWEISCEINENE